MFSWIKNRISNTFFTQHQNAITGTHIDAMYLNLAPTVIETRNILKKLDSNPQDFYQLIERLSLVYPHSITEFTTRKNSLSKIQYVIKSKDREDDPRAEQVMEDIRPIMKTATKSIQESLLYGIMPKEIVWDAAGSRVVPKALIPVRRDQFFWINGQLHYAEQPGYKTQAREITDEDWFHLFAPTYFHMEPTLDRHYYGGLFKYVSVISAMTFYVLYNFYKLSGRYGKPTRIGKYEQGARDADIKAVKDAVFDMGEDLGAVIPADSTLELLESKNIGSGTDMFETIMHRLDGHITKLYNGQTLGTTAEKYGTRAQSDFQGTIRQDYFEIDLERNEEWLQTLIDRHWYLNYSQTQPCPLYIENTYKPPKDLVKLSTVVQNLRSAGAGKQIPARWVNETFDIPEPQEGEETLTDPDPGF